MSSTAAPPTLDRPRPAAAGGPVQSVERSLRILSAFRAPEDVLLVGEQAARLGVHKSTASRLMATLVLGGFLERVGDEGFRPGPELARLGRLSAPRGLPDLARTAMDDLGAATGETITLAVAVGGTATTVAQTDARYVVGAQSWVGRRSPLHATSDGKVLLAFGAGEPRAGRLERRTARTTTDRAALGRQLARVRARGWASAVGDFEDGLHGVAAPVLAPDGSCLAALCVSGPAYRLPEGELPALAARCVEAARRIATEIAAAPAARPAPTAATAPAARPAPTAATAPDARPAR